MQRHLLQTSIRIRIEVEIEKSHRSGGECEVALLWRAAQQNHGHGTSKVQTLTVDLTFRESLVPWLGQAGAGVLLKQYQMRICIDRIEVAVAPK